MQQLPAAQRRRVLIDNDPVVELDFAAMHARLLYARRGIEIPTDPYSFAPTVSREDHKIVFQRLLNCKSRREAIRSIALELRKLTWTGDASELIARVYAAHPKLRDLFFCGEGLRLQRLDSDIAEDVMLDFVKLGEPIIPIHDSFIVRAVVEDQLRTSMERAYLKNVGFKPTIKKSL